MSESKRGDPFIEKRENDRIMNECLHKGTQIIMQSRLPKVASSANGLKNKWFNIETPENDYIREQLTNELNRGQGIHSMLQIDFLIQSPSLPQSILLERWNMHYESSNLAAPRKTDMGLVYKKTIILIRSLYSQTRILPAYQLFRALQSQEGATSASQSPSFSIITTLHGSTPSQAPVFDTPPGDFVFSSINTSTGKLHMSVFYRKDCSFDFVKQKPAAIHRHIIQDYIPDEADRQRRMSVPPRGTPPPPPPGIPPSAAIQTRHRRNTMPSLDVASTSLPMAIPGPGNRPRGYDLNASGHSLPSHFSHGGPGASRANAWDSPASTYEHSPDQPHSLPHSTMMPRMHSLNERPVTTRSRSRSTSADLRPAAFGHVGTPPPHPSMPQHVKVLSSDESHYSQHHPSNNPHHHQHTHSMPNTSYAQSSSLPMSIPGRQSESPFGRSPPPFASSHVSNSFQNSFAMHQTPSPPVHLGVHVGSVSSKSSSYNDVDDYARQEHELSILDADKDFAQPAASNEPSLMFGDDMGDDPDFGTPLADELEQDAEAMLGAFMKTIQAAPSLAVFRQLKLTRAGNLAQLQRDIHDLEAFKARVPVEEAGAADDVVL